MSEPIHVGLINLMSNGDMSGNLTSSSYLLNGIRSYCIQVTWNGTSPVGTLDYQGSIDGVNYATLASASISSNSGTSMLNVELPAYVYSRVVYTRTSGSGTLNVLINSKR